MLLLAFAAGRDLCSSAPFCLRASGSSADGVEGLSRLASEFPEEVLLLALGGRSVKDLEVEIVGAAFPVNVGAADRPESPSSSSSYVFECLLADWALACRRSGAIKS